MIAYEDEELPDEEGMAEVIESVLQPWLDSSEVMVMPVTMMPPMTEESAKEGHKLFLKHACNKCHGVFGRGGSMGNVEVGSDAWGNKAAAADLTSGMFRGGGSPLDIYRRIHSGINGTPMPAFEKLFAEDPDAIWQLVHFIKQTGNRRRMGLGPLGEADLPEGVEIQAPASTATEDESEEEDSETAEDDAEESDEDGEESESVVADTDEEEADEPEEDSEAEEESTPEADEDAEVEESAEEPEAESDTEESSDEPEAPAEEATEEEAPDAESDEEAA